MEQNYTNPNAWYEKTWLVILLCIIFFPVGLYALWKNSSIAKGWKITVTVVIALIVLAQVGDNSKKGTSNDNSADIESKIENQDNSVADSQTEKIDLEKEAVKEKLKAKAKRDWPDDYMTQEFWVNQQMDDYEYMFSIENNSIKSKAQKDWPLDFTTQKF